MENHTHFLKLLDFTPAEIQEFLDTAADLKAKKKAGVPHKLLEGKNVALIFEKTSTRTRCAFEVAAQDLGMGSTYLGPTGSQIGVKESIADTARVLGRMYDGIEYRGFGQDIVEELVGEIWDEHDEVVQEIVQISEREYKFSGRASVKKLFDLMDEEDESEAATVGGWVMEQLKKIPAVGDNFDYKGTHVEVTEMEEKRVLSVHVILPEEEKTE